MTDPIHWYRLGDATLGVTGDDLPLAGRFAEIYGECGVAEPGDLPRVLCRVRNDGARVTIAFEDPEPLDVLDFVAAAFPDRGYDAAAPGLIRLPGDAGTVAVSADGRTLTASPESGWRPLVANLAVSRVLRLQREVLFFHAASAAVGGRGILACGPKRAGKTTLAMTLATRGHQLLGDEMAAVRLPMRELLPVRRSLAVRAGPAATLARAALERGGAEPEIFPDGERRERIAIGRLFPDPAESAVPLAALLLLRGFAPEARAERATPAPSLLSHLTPLAASLWNRPPGSIMIHLMRLLSATPVYWVDAGPPEATALLVERLLEPT